MEDSSERSYEDLIDAFGEERLKNRISYLIGSAKNFQINREIEQFVAVNKRLIYEVVIDYFSDIKRLKDFHTIEKTEPYKVAGYTAYWILRRKPLYVTIENIKDGIYDKKPELICVNEWFAYSIMISMVFNRKKQIFKAAKVLKKYNNFTKRLHYCLTYRIVTPQLLELILYTLNVEPPMETKVLEEC